MSIKYYFKKVKQNKTKFVIYLQYIILQYIIIYNSLKFIYNILRFYFASSEQIFYSIIK